jgi:hypothetical protein
MASGDGPASELVTLCPVIPPIPIDKQPAPYQADLLAQGVTYVVDRQGRRANGGLTKTFPN